MKYSTLLFGFAIGCSGGGTQVVTTTGNGPADDGDTVAPEIEHEPIDAAQYWGEDVFVEATVTDDNSGVFMVRVVYKQETSTFWYEAGLTAQNSEGFYSGVIPGEDVGSAGMHYYIYAVDYEDNTAYMPDDGEEDAYHFRVSAD